jgi:sterol desaturase/sphingolipid hydroxylase (fatty acid hydroxylase superfamily)
VGEQGWWGYSDHVATKAWRDRELNREAFRRREVEAIPRLYSPWLHLALTTLPGMAVVVGAAVFITDLGLLELLAVPVTFVLANLGEWHAHRHLLHRRWKVLPLLYDKHTPMHHRIYRYDDMEIRSTRELKLVLIPATGVMALVVFNAGVALGIGALLSANVGWLYLATVGVYVVSYELSHAAYHLPATHPIGRLRLVRRLRELHAIHHDPRVMQRWNFNVTLPLADWLFGTLTPPELVAQVRARAHEPWNGETLGGRPPAAPASDAQGSS